MRSCSASSKPMIKQDAKSKLGLIGVTVLLFALAYILDLSLSVPLFLLLVFIYLRFSQQAMALPGHRLLHLALLFVLFLAVSWFILKGGFSFFFIPFCMMPMLVMLLFEDLRISLLMTLALSFVISSLIGINLYVTLFFLVSGIASSIFLSGVRRRNTIIQAGFLIGVLQAITWFTVTGLSVNNARDYLIIFLNGVASSILVVGILPVFEYLFSTITNISLLELADFDNPLLQRMMMEAPGTYHHSLVVGNLSEAACHAIGAPALLARIGAYYHDIGKLSKPEYFSENQDVTGSKHDALAPTISKMVIMNHVKEGMELGTKYKLNHRIIDFIQQHHGTSLVYYFYRRALESSENVDEIGEEGFRYTGPKPSTRETAIVLLADSVEAATRALKEPTAQNIEELVHKIVNNKFIDGQLDECTLTLKDLEKISNVFVRILAAIYHSRVSYPEAPK